MFYTVITVVFIVYTLFERKRILEILLFFEKKNAIKQLRALSKEGVNSYQ